MAIENQSEARLKRLVRAGAKPVGEKKTNSVATNPAETVVTVKELRAIADPVISRVEAIEKIHEHILKHQQQLESLISQILATGSSEPPITGFKMNRGADGFTETVSLIRGKNTAIN